MRIGIDARCLEEDRISGVGEYALELFRGMLENDRENKYIFFSNSYYNISEQNLNWIKIYKNAKIKKFRIPNKLLNFFFWYFNWPKIDKILGNIDVFFAPNINFLPTSSRCPLIVTFHDLSFERFPEYFPLKSMLWHKYFVGPRKIARRARSIISVSQSTKNDLQEVYGIRSQKIRTIFHGIGSDFRVLSRDDDTLSVIRKKYGLPSKFILYLGNVETRKNISSLISAYETACLRDETVSKYKLVLAGKRNLKYIPKNNRNILFCGYIERQDRPYFYNLASLFVYPSFFEGFGLPILEAMACGTPVVASNNSSIPEVVGNSSLLVNPHRPEQISEAIISILSDEKLSKILKERGQRRAEKYRWKKTAKKTIDFILSIRSESPA